MSLITRTQLTISGRDVRLGATQADEGRAGSPVVWTFVIGIPQGGSDIIALIDRDLDIAMHHIRFESLSFWRRCRAGWNSVHTSMVGMHDWATGDQGRLEEQCAQALCLRRRSNADQTFQLDQHSKRSSSASSSSLTSFSLMLTVVSTVLVSLSSSVGIGAGSRARPTASIKSRVAHASTALLFTCSSSAAIRVCGRFSRVRALTGNLLDAHVLGSSRTRGAPQRIQYPPHRP